MDATATKPVAGAGRAGKIFAQIHELIEKTRGEPGALIQVLEQAQGIIGYLPEPVLMTISREMKVPLSTVYGIISFYSFFTTVPRGKYVVNVCLGTCCYVRGGERILNTLQKELSIEPGATTTDGRFSLQLVRCLGCCGLAPVVGIDDRIYRRMTPTKMKEVLGTYA